MQWLLLFSFAVLAYAGPPPSHVASPPARAAAPLPDKDASHRELVAAKKAEWIRLGVEFDEVAIPDAGDLTMLIVRAKKPGAKLNELAAEAAAKFGGVVFAYSPRNLDHELGHKTAAKYNHLHNRVYLPEDIDARKIPESVSHELLHAQFYHVMYQAKDSLFHGELTATDKTRGLWSSGFYHAHMSFQELAAFPLSLDLIADEMKGKPAETKAWKHLSSKTKILEEISRGTVGVLDDFLGAMKRGENVGLEVKRQTFERTGKQARWAHLERGNVKLKIPFFGNERPTAETVKAALEKRRDLYSRILGATEKVHGELKDIVNKLEKSEAVAPASLDGVLERAKGIRGLAKGEIPE